MLPCVSAAGVDGGRIQRGSVKMDKMLDIVFRQFGKSGTVANQPAIIIQDSELLAYGDLVQVVDGQHIFNVREIELNERPRRGDLIALSDKTYTIERVLPTIRSGEFAILASEVAPEVESSEP